MMNDSSVTKRSRSVILTDFLSLNCSVIVLLISMSVIVIRHQLSKLTENTLTLPNAECYGAVLNRSQ